MKIWTNPFENYTERVLLSVGILGIFIATIITKLNNILFLGSLKLVNNYPKEWYEALLNILINVGANTLILFLFAMVIYSRTRFVDVLNTVLIAHLAVFALGIISVIPIVGRTLKMMELRVLDPGFEIGRIPGLDMFVLIIFSICTLGLLFYFFYLLVVGMKVATNKKQVGYVVIMVLLVLILNTFLQFLNPYF